MHKKFNHEEIEKKWHTTWQKENLYKTDADSTKPKAYVLDMFPYPSGEGLHVGHPKGYIATDIYSRFKKMSGFEVLHPMGWDAFGLPAENFAIKHKIHPRVAVEKNIANFKGQLAKLGFNYDWSREINTTDPEYYKWTQWIFLKLLEHGLAYQSYEPINWCPSCQTGLANEDLESDGTCERCGSVVEKKPMRQWVLKITEYADRMLQDLDTLTAWPAHIKEAQRKWIGRSQGARIDFPLSLPHITGDIVFATNNKSKVERMRALASHAGLSITIKTPEEVGIQNFSVIEDQKTIEGNAEKKARALSLLTDLPVFADDSGFFIDDEEINPVTVKRNALNGKREEDLSIEEIGSRMATYYADIASKRGGSVRAEWRNALCLAIKGNIRHVEAVRPVLLTNEIHGDIDPHLPLRCLYKPLSTNKYVVDETEEEKMLELQPLADAFRKLLTPTISVFTTRPDTLYGATYLVLAPEHPWVTLATDDNHNVLKNKTVVLNYVKKAREKSHIERTNDTKEKTGVEIQGVRALNPVTGKEIPLFVADYVLAEYGTGAIMAVPAHDERDFAFAQTYNLPFVQVIEGTKSLPFADMGTLINSGEFTGKNSEEAKVLITKKVDGVLTSTYRLNDWVFSRQRYWGEPIPVIHCGSCGVVPVPFEELPVRLPEVEHYEPTGTGESPLAGIADWVNTPCPRCGKPAQRETNTMPQWAGSSWYYLRFIDPSNTASLIDPEKEKKWAPVDVYVGGDHAVRHLIYARFWHKFLYDIGVVHTIEPFMRLEFLGFILAPDGRKMSKRWGNVINPDDIVKQNGADTLRVYEMFMGPFENTIAWNIDSLTGAQRFLERVYGLDAHFTASQTVETTRLIHKTIKKVSDDIESFKFNTAVSALMIFINHAEKEGITTETYKTFLTLLAPFAPYLTEELWHKAGETGSIHATSWPPYDEQYLKDDTVSISVQVNGKMRGLVTVPEGADESTVLEAVISEPSLKEKVTGKPNRVIYVKNKIINLILE